MKNRLNKGKSVLVALSGGVDSSVAAFLLKKQGYNVAGAFMKCFNLDGCAVTDAEDARRVASHLNIPFYTFDFEEEYKKRVVKYMIDGYKKGITPNPDVMCNKTVKFDLFLKQAKKMDFDFIATGHYVRIARNVLDVVNVVTEKAQLQQAKRYNKRSDTTLQLFASLDANKDQTYFLWTLTQDVLKHCLFPIGDYKKPEVRKIAKKAGLATAEKKDSQGICFLGKVSLASFLKKYIKPKRGDILDVKGNKIGEHEGVYFYTVGQRHGFKIKIKDALSKPHYIVSKDVKTNTLVTAEENDPALFKKELVLTNLNFINPNISALIRANEGYDIFARIRYRQPLQKATLCLEVKPPNMGKLTFAKPQKFIAPGQSAVLYNNKGELLGGGIIK